MAARPYWKGYLKLSLVSCSIALYAAVSSTERVSFNQINKRTGNRVKYKKIDADTGDEVAPDDIVKGYQVEKNVYVTVEDDEIEAIQIESAHTIEIDSFVPLGHIDARYYDSPYYVVPNDAVGQDAFAVIREAMRGKNLVGLGRVVIAKRERPVALEAAGKGLRAMTLRYPYEIKDEKDYFSDIPDVKIPGEMLKLAEHILDSKAADFDPGGFVDRYENALVEMIKNKQAGAIYKTAAPVAHKPTGNVIDLLKRSLELENRKTKPKVKAPSLQPSLPKTKGRAKSKAS